MQQVGAPPEPSEPEHRRGARWGIALGAVAALAALLLLVSFNGTSPSNERLSDQALDAVADLEKAVDEGDAAGVIDLLAPGWAVLDLPGSTQQVVPTSDQPRALQLYVETVELDFGGCEAEPAADPLTHLVQCDATVTGDLPKAFGYENATEVLVGVNGEAIVSVFQAPVPADAGSDYCVWAKLEHTHTAVDAFDINCYPIGGSSVHNQLAARFVEAGRPELPVIEADSASIVLFVETFQHDPQSLASIFAQDWPLVRYPGLLPIQPSPPFPKVSEYLAWSDLAYEVELGTCEVTARLQNGGLRVECPEARWGGPLVTSLGLGSVAQQIGFFVEDGAITGVVGTTSPILDEAVIGLCKWADSNRVGRVAIAFRADCTPHYTPEGAAEIVALAADRIRSG